MFPNKIKKLNQVWVIDLGRVHVWTLFNLKQYGTNFTISLKATINNIIPKNYKNNFIHNLSQNTILI